MGDPRERGPLPRPAGQPGRRYPAPRRAGPPDLRQPGLLPAVRRWSAATVLGRSSSAPACSPATRRRPWRPAPSCASSATCSRSRPRAGRAGSSGRSTRSRPAMPPSPRCNALGRDITERRRTEAELQGGAQAGGSRQPRQVALPGGHEPRDPHADERHPRHDVAAVAIRTSPPSSAPTPTPSSARRARCSP